MGGFSNVGICSFDSWTGAMGYELPSVWPDVSKLLAWYVAADSCFLFRILYPP